MSRPEDDSYTQDSSRPAPHQLPSAQTARYQRHNSARRTGTIDIRTRAASTTDTRNTHGTQCTRAPRRIDVSLDSLGTLQLHPRCPGDEHILWHRRRLRRG